jgi:hypothetical protein
MIDPRRAQLSFGDRLIAEEVDGLYEEWMVHADEVLADEAIVMAAYEALAKRHRLSRNARSARLLRGSGRPPARPQARSQLELRRARAGGARQSRLSQVPAWPMPRPWANGAWRWSRRWRPVQEASALRKKELEPH